MIKQLVSHSFCFNARKFLARASFLLLLPALALAGCNQAGAASGGDTAEQVSVVTTVFAPYDFTREITAGQAEITMLLPPGSETHSFEPTPQDIIKIQNCDLFIYAGGETDIWVDEILSSIDTSKVNMIAMMDCVAVVEEEIVEGMEDDEHDHAGEGHAEEEHAEEAHVDEEPAGEEHAEEEHAEEAHAEEGIVYDEHVWTSPKNAKLIVQAISDQLCAADAANASVYQENTVVYLDKLDGLDAAFQAVVDGATRKTLVFGDRFPFRYFTDAYGLDYFAAFPGCSTDTEPSAATVAFLIDKVAAEKLPVVLHAEMSNGKMADTISEATGAQVLQLHACHNVTRDEFLGGETYLDLMTKNVDVLKEALM